MPETVCEFLCVPGCRNPSYYLAGELITFCSTDRDLGMKASALEGKQTGEERIARRLSSVNACHIQWGNINEPSEALTRGKATETYTYSTS